MELENMDCMTIKELDEYYDLLSLAKQYASWKKAAVGYRLDGSIKFALDCENECEKIYSKIPQESRW